MYLVIFDEAGLQLSSHDTVDDIAVQLTPLGVDVGEIIVDTIDSDDAHVPVQQERQQLATLRERYRIQSVDRVAIEHGDPRWPTLREQFRREHTHSDHEIRIFLRGRGLFSVRGPDGILAQLLCEAGEWLALPPQTLHAFDAGQQADFEALRLFAATQGWTANYTQSADALPPPDLDQFVAQHVRRDEARHRIAA